MVIPHGNRRHYDLIVSNALADSRPFYSRERHPYRESPYSVMTCPICDNSMLTSGRPRVTIMVTITQNRAVR